MTIDAGVDQVAELDFRRFDRAGGQTCQGSLGAGIRFADQDLERIPHGDVAVQGVVKRGRGQVGVGMQGLDIAEQIDLGADQAVIVHDAEIDRTAGQAAQQRIGDAAIDRSQPRAQAERRHAYR